MTDRLVIALAQLNPTLGAIQANLAKAQAACLDAAGADLVLFSELFICGYPPEDLVQRPSFVAQCRAAVEELAKDTKMEFTQLHFGRESLFPLNKDIQLMKVNFLHWFKCARNIGLF